MPGNWNVSDTTNRDQRSGFYLNVIGDQGAGVASGSLGVVAIAAALNWGPVGTIVDLETFEDFKNVFGNKREDTVPGHFLAEQAMLASPQTTKVYRLDKNGASASVTLLAAAASLVTLTAKYPGARANDFSVTIQNNVLDGTKKDLVLYEGSKVLATVTYDGTATDLTAQVNTAGKPAAAFVSAAKTADGTPDLVANRALSGGTNGAALTATEYTNAMNAFEVTAQDWNVIVFNNVTDASIHATVKSWINRLRTEGAYVKAILGTTLPGSGAEAATFDAACTAAAGLNSPGIIYSFVYGTATGEAAPRSSADWCGRIAGLLAAYGPFKSLTHAAIDNITLAYPLTNTQIRKANGKGLMTAYPAGSGALIEKGINTKVTYDPANSEHEGFSKIKVIEIVDAAAKALSGTGNSAWVGKVPNDGDGADFVIGAVKSYLKGLEAGANRLFKPGTTNAEIDPAHPQQGDQFYFIWSGTPVDSMDEIYATGIIGR